MRDDLWLRLYWYTTLWINVIRTNLFSVFCGLEAKGKGDSTTPVRNSKSKDFKIGSLPTTDYSWMWQSKHRADCAEYAKRAQESNCCLTLFDEEAVYGGTWPAIAEWKDKK